MKIAFFDAKKYDVETFDKANNSKHEIKYFEDNLEVANANVTKGFDAVCGFVNTDGSAAVLQRLKENGVKYWFQRSMGYDRIDLKEAQKLNVKVFRVQKYSTESVAEHALSLMMALNRNIYKAARRTKNCNFTLNDLEGKVIQNSTVGVIGCGQIGQSFIKITRGLGAKVVVFDAFAQHHHKELSKKLRFEWVNKTTLFKTSDFISLHVPLLPETKYIINQKAVQMMKKGVTIVNTSRGKLVKTEALVEGLKLGIVKNVGLDVLKGEHDKFYFDLSKRQELVKADLNWKYLLEHDNVIVTSHQAFFTHTALAQIAKTTIENANRAEEQDFATALVYQGPGKILNG